MRVFSTKTRRLQESHLAITTVLIIIIISITLSLVTGIQEVKAVHVIQTQVTTHADTRSLDTRIIFPNTANTKSFSSRTINSNFKISQDSPESTRALQSGDDAIFTESSAGGTHVIKRVWFDLNHQNFTNDNDSIAYADFLEFYLNESRNFIVNVLNATTAWDDVSLNASEDVVILPDIETELTLNEIDALRTFYQEGGRIIIIGSADERDPTENKAPIHRASLNSLLQQVNAGISFRENTPTGYFNLETITWNHTSSFFASMVKDRVSGDMNGKLFAFLDVQVSNNTKIAGYLDLGTDIGGLRYPIVMAEHVGTGKILVVGSESPFLKATSTNEEFWDALIEWLEMPLLESRIILPNEWFTDEAREVSLTISTPFTHGFEWFINYSLSVTVKQNEIILARASQRVITSSGSIINATTYRTPKTESTITFTLDVSLVTSDGREKIANFATITRSLNVSVAYQVKDVVAGIGANIAGNTFAVEENSTFKFFLLLDNNKNEPINLTILLQSEDSSISEVFSPSRFSTTINPQQQDYLLNFSATIKPSNALKFGDADTLTVPVRMVIIIDDVIMNEEEFSVVFFKPIILTMGEHAFSIIQNEKVSLDLTIKNNRFEPVDVNIGLKNAQGFFSGFVLEQDVIKVAPQSTTTIPITLRHQTSLPYDSGTKKFFLTVEVPKLHVKEEFEITVEIGMTPNNILVGYIIPSLFIFLPPIFAFFNWRKKEHAKMAIMEYIKKNKIAAVSILVKEFKVKASFVEDYLKSKEIKDAFPNGKYFSSVKTFVVLDEDLIKRFKELVDTSKILRLRDLKKEFAAPVEVSNMLLQLFVEKGYLQGEINEKRTGFVSLRYIEDTIYKGFEEGMVSIRQLEQQLELNQTKIRKYVLDLAKAKNIKIHATELQDVYYTDAGIHTKVTHYLNKKLIASLSEIAMHLKMDRNALQKALSKADYYNLTTFLDREGELWIAVAHLTSTLVQAIQKRKHVSLQELASHLKIPGHLTRPLIESLVMSKMLRGGFIGKDVFVEESWIIDKLRTNLPFMETANLHQIAQELEINYEAVFNAVKTMINMGILIGFVDKTGVYHEIDRPTTDVTTTQEDAQIRPVPSLSSNLQFLKGDIVYHVEVTNTTNEVLINPVIDVYFEDQYLYPLKTDPEDLGKIIPPSEKESKWRFYAKLPNILPNQSKSVSFRFEPLHMGRTIMRAFMQYESGVTGDKIGVSIPRIVFDVKPPSNLAPSEQSVASCKNMLSSKPSDFKKMVISDPTKVREAFRVLIDIMKKHKFNLVGSTRLSTTDDEWEEEAWFYACIKSDDQQETPIVARVIGSKPSSSLHIEIATEQEDLIATLLLAIAEDLEKEAKKRVGTETKQAYGRLKSQECNNCGAPLDSLPIIGKDVKCEFCNTVYTYELLA